MPRLLYHIISCKNNSIYLKKQTLLLLFYIALCLRTVPIKFMQTLGVIATHLLEEWKDFLPIPMYIC